MLGVIAFLDKMTVRAQRYDRRLFARTEKHLSEVPCERKQALRMLDLLLCHLPQMSYEEVVQLAKQLANATRTMKRMCARESNFTAIMEQWITLYADSLRSLPDMLAELCQPQWWPVHFASWQLAGSSTVPSLGAHAMATCHAAHFGADGSHTLLEALLRNNKPDETEHVLQLVRSGVVTKGDVGTGDSLVRFAAAHRATLPAQIEAYHAAGATYGITRWYTEHERAQCSKAIPSALPRLVIATPEAMPPRPRIRTRPATAPPPAAPHTARTASPGPVIHRNQMPPHLRPARLHAITILTVLWSGDFIATKLIDEAGLRKRVRAKLGEDVFTGGRYAKALDWCMALQLVKRGEGANRSGLSLNVTPPHRRGKKIIARVKLLR